MKLDIILTPHHTLDNERIFVKMSEVVDAISTKLGLSCTGCNKSEKPNAPVFEFEVTSPDNKYNEAVWCKLVTGARNCTLEVLWNYVSAQHGRLALDDFKSNSDSVGRFQIHVNSNEDRAGFGVLPMSIAFTASHAVTVSYGEWLSIIQSLCARRSLHTIPTFSVNSDDAKDIHFDGITVLKVSSDDQENVQNCIGVDLCKILKPDEIKNEIESICRFFENVVVEGYDIHELEFITPVRQRVVLQPNTLEPPTNEER